MRHVLVCREFPPVTGGGIGSYTERIATLMAEGGELVHVVSQLWKGADRPLERRCGGRLVIHRVPCERAGSLLGLRPHPNLKDPAALDLFRSSYHAQAFAWTASRLIERLVEDDGIDIIEGPEYEAPLYFFQLRRLLGLGPARKPPCVVHLHSPTELIVRYNDWDLGHPYFLTAKRLEDFSVSAADALLCPSRALADEIAARADLGCEPARIIHYPLRDRAGQTGGSPRADGPVVYVGRLERRKGVIEWIEAAVEAARRRPLARFELVGRPVLDTDWRSSGDVLRDLVPSDVRDRFRFRGPVDYSRVREILASARMAVVPSRWDNFPNTCMEAMSMGLPVLVTPNGGMVQLVEEGVSGWVAASSEPADLHAALMRALDTPETRLRDMGRAARASVAERCDPERIVSSHLELKEALVAGGARRSLGVPPALGASERDPGLSHSGERGRAVAVGVVVTCATRARPDHCLAALAAQSVPPAAIVLVRYGASGDEPVPLSVPEGLDLQVVDRVEQHRADALRAGVEVLREMSPSPGAVAILDESDAPARRHVERCGEVLGRQSAVGVASFWERVGGAVVSRPCPARPYQWLWNDAAAASVFRIDALGSLVDLPLTEDPMYDRWYLANTVLASGWAGVTVPEVLAERSTPVGWVSRLDSTRAVEAIHRPFRVTMAEDAPELVSIARSGFAGTLRSPTFRPREFSELAVRLVSDWRHALTWGWKKVAGRVWRG